MEELCKYKSTRSIYKRAPNIYKLLRNDKDKIGMKEKAGVYRIPFENQQLGVEKDYVGVTTRNLAVRLKEHMYDVSKGNNNTILAIMAQTDGASVKWDEARIVKPVHSPTIAFGIEKMEIYKIIVDVDVVKYLLNTVKFRYVLTRRFNSDPIESFFSCIHQFNGGNDKLDARSASLTTQMILKVGILQAAQNGNAPCSSFSSKLLPVMTETNFNVEDKVCKLHYSSLSILQKLQSLTQDCSVPCTIENASLAVISGYLIRVLKEKVACHECLEILNHPTSNGVLFGLISNQDRGQLRYPRSKLVGVIRILTDFFDDVLTYTNPRQADLKVKLVKVIEKLPSTVV
ncbi:uncharacterized protein LOC111624069 [Centruroides sculpturatus]|uniref:uncharacterized protein LOC111624069 n=1 Tax=Centruroides sculpturatus TaxID=218467 RepID=UPI000C6E625F|nr:uncharacterized protein LOC111624069 [Centruroides sculpturatus]